MQSTLAPVSGRAHSVANLSSLFFFIFSFKFTMGVGQPDIAVFTAGFNIEHFVFVDCLTMFAAFTLKYSFFLLLFRTKQ